MADQHQDVMQDHLLIVKAFERGAHHSPSEDSVFAMMTPMLSNMQSQAQGFIQQADGVQEVLETQSVGESEVDAGSWETKSLKSTSKEGYTNNDLPDFLGIDTQKATTAYDDEKSDPTPDITVGDYLLPGGAEKQEVVGGKTLAEIINECVPCRVRLMSPSELWEKIQSGVNAQLKMQWGAFQAMLEQIKSLLNFFSGDAILDFCNFLAFFSKFICIPDLRRIIAMLMVMMSNVAFELTNVFDLVVQLIGPLMLPFLNVIFGLLQQFMFMIVEPIQCIIESISQFLGKLDYAALYSSPSGGHVEIGPGEGYTEHDIVLGNEPAKPGPVTSFLRDSVGDTRHTHNNLNWGLKFDMFTPVSSFADATTKDEQRGLVDAQVELDKLVQEDRDRVVKTRAEAEEINTKILAARDKVAAAQNELSSTEIAQARQQLQRVQSGIRNVMLTIVRFMNDAREVVESFFELISSEIEALLNQLVGTGNDGIRLLWDKSQIIQIIGFILALIKGLQSKCDNDEGATGTSADPYKNMKGLTVSEDDNGNITIEENIDGEDEDIASAFQGLGDVVEFTKDPVLDSEIAKAVEQLQTPVKVVRKCPFQTTVGEAEQVNEWIAELNAQ